VSNYLLGTLNKSYHHFYKTTEAAVLLKQKAPAKNIARAFVEASFKVYGGDRFVDQNLLGCWCFH
jgi:hypothetical protein